LPFVGGAVSFALSFIPPGLKMRRTEYGYTVRKWYLIALLIEAAHYARSPKAIAYRNELLKPKF
jgi:hypothetical protein